MIKSENQRIKKSIMMLEALEASYSFQGYYFNIAITSSLTEV